MTSRHRGPKQKLRAGYRATSLQCTSDLRVGLFREASSTFHRQVWHRTFSALCASYARIWHSGIILTPRLPFSKISFVAHPPLLSYPVEKTAHSITHSIIQLLWFAGNWSFCYETYPAFYKFSPRCKITGSDITCLSYGTRIKLILNRKCEGMMKVSYCIDVNE